jgi:hypothetical protein
MRREQKRSSRTSGKRGASITKENGIGMGLRSAVRSSTSVTASYGPAATTGQARRSL